ncbi:MAG: hypothetical protein P8Y23_16390, partial [Candidatus Lokiarchaeota archaeon]
FNVSVYYEDTVRGVGILGADISVQIEGFDYTTTIFDYEDGYYNITIDFTDTEFTGYGAFDVRIDVNLTNYYNSTNFLSIDVLGETSVSVTKIPDLITFDSGDQLNISVYYEDIVRGIGIPGADISIKVDGSDYTTTIFDYENGYYIITIDFTDPEFMGYGTFNLQIDTKLSHYYNSTDFLSVSVLGETSVIISKIPNLITYDSGDQLNISIYYEDSIRGVGIPGADISIQVDGSDYTTTIFDYENGYYNITIDFSDSEFTGYGTFNLQIDTKLSYYYNSTDFLSVNVLGETSASVSKIPDLTTYDSEDLFNISVYYEDMIRNLGITGANITAQVDSSDYTTTIFDYGNGYYNISVNCSDLIFDGYGWISFKVDINLPNYYNYTEYMDIKILGLTDYSLLNLTQYNQLVNQNDTIYEAFQGENITLYMNFINLLFMGN